VLVVLIRLFSPPGEADASYGVFLALVASLVAAGGGLMAVGGGSPRG
jgi:hypothetical protein